MDSQNKPIVVYVCRLQDTDSSGKFARFFDSYKQHPPGHDHDLVVIKKGFQNDEKDWKQWTAQMTGIPFELRAYPDKNYVFGYIRQLMEEYPDKYILVLNASSEILVDDWLSRYMIHAAPGRLLGAMGAYTSLAAPPFTWYNLLRSSGRNRSIWRQSLLRRLTGCQGNTDVDKSLFHPFPNPGLRTTGFMIPPGILNSIWYWPRAEEIHSKLIEHLFESGKYGLTVQSLAAGYEVLVVAADGQAWPIDRWRESETFRHKEQKNLIIGDHLSKKYRNASPKVKVKLEKMTFGSASEEIIHNRIELMRNTDMTKIHSFYPRKPI